MFSDFVYVLNISIQIDNLLRQEKMPIIVGGTNYYIESVVYNILVEDSNDSESLLWDRSRRKRDMDDNDMEEEGTTVKKKPNDPEATIADAAGSSKNESSDDRACASSENEGDNTKPITKEDLQRDINNEKHFSNEELHDKLRKIDPVMASKLHPNNRRKVLR